MAYNEIVCSLTSNTLHNITQWFASNIVVLGWLFQILVIAFIETVCTLIFNDSKYNTMVRLLSCSPKNVSSYYFSILKPDCLYSIKIYFQLHNTVAQCQHFVTVGGGFTSFLCH